MVSDTVSLNAALLNCTGFILLFFPLPVVPVQTGRKQSNDP